jgi:hypothetical protein
MCTATNQSNILINCVEYRFACISGYKPPAFFFSLSCNYIVHAVCAAGELPFIYLTFESITEYYYVNSSI